MDENTAKIINGLNEEVSEYIQFLESIEALCTDKKTCNKIKEFLKLKKIW
jgi:mannitol/fructose-specific phosphotransferase system IIA component